jgi:argininosuccinate lyase
VKEAQGKGVDLSELPIETLKGFHASIEKDVYDVLSLEGSMNARKVVGGTAVERVREAIGTKRLRL